MKHQNYVYKKSSFTCFMMLLFGLFFSNTISAQLGPTVVIASNKSGNDYLYSKTNTFKISPSVGNTGYTLVKVGSVVSGEPSYQYLNQAINQYLVWNYQRIIILEGEYEVNGPIYLDYLNDFNPNPINTPTSSNLGRITIEGEGFGTRIINASNYTSGNIFEVPGNSLLKLSKII